MSITYQQWCLPKDSVVLHRAMHDAAYCECLEFIWLAQEGDCNEIDTRYMADMMEVKRSNNQTGRVFAFEKGWDVMRVCLTSDMPPIVAASNEKALNGAIGLNASAKTTQGFKFKYIPYVMLNDMLLGLERLQYQQFVMAASKKVWQQAYGSRFYTSASCWELFLAWKAFLKQAKQKQCDIICVTS
jgi:hypothetical protein